MRLPIWSKLKEVNNLRSENERLSSENKTLREVLETLISKLSLTSGVNNLPEKIMIYISKSPGCTSGEVQRYFDLKSVAQASNELRKLYKMGFVDRKEKGKTWKYYPLKKSLTLTVNVNEKIIK